MGLPETWTGAHVAIWYILAAAATPEQSLCSRGLWGHFATLATCLRLSGLILQMARWLPLQSHTPKSSHQRLLAKSHRTSTADSCGDPNRQKEVLVVYILVGVLHTGLSLDGCNAGPHTWVRIIVRVLLQVFPVFWPSSFCLER